MTHLSTLHYFLAHEYFLSDCSHFYVCVMVCAKMTESNAGNRYSKRMVLEFFPLEWKRFFGDGRMEVL